MNRTKIIWYAILGIAALVILAMMGGKSVAIARMMAKLREKALGEKIKIKEKELDKIEKKEGHVSGKIEEKQKELDKIIKNQNKLKEKAEKAESVEEIMDVFRSIK